MDIRIKNIIDKGTVIPASPLALNADRKLNECRQRAVYRYYYDAGAGGIAVGVHTTQFQIRDPKIGLFEPVLALAAEEMSAIENSGKRPLVKIAGVCGKTDQAAREAETARSLGYHAVLLSLAAFKSETTDQMVQHCRVISEILPLIGFYLQPAVGGRVIPYSFWREFAQIENVAAIKMAPFNRYQTIDVMRAIAESGRDDIALYTGNDDNIVMDLLTTYRFVCNGRPVERRIVGGLLGHWSVWTRKAVELLDECHKIANSGVITQEMLTKSMEVTDSNAAFFDAANGFRGCICGLHEVLRRQGIFEGIWCLDPDETPGPDQMEEIDRVYAAYPHLNDDDFVSENLDRWLS